MKASSAELRKKEKENRRLQQELTTEKDKFNQMVEKYQKDLQDLQVISFIKSRIYFSVPILKNSLITRKKSESSKMAKIRPQKRLINEEISKSRDYLI